MPGGSWKYGKVSRDRGAWPEELGSWEAERKECKRVGDDKTRGSRWI